MLGYILSKMQMLIFAAGILFVAILFLNFISNLELNTAADNILLTNTSSIISVLSAKESLDYSKTVSIPDRIVYGLGTSNQLFYDLNFSSVYAGDKNNLILSINEHGRKNIISARKVVMSEAIILIDPEFLKEGTPTLQKFSSSYNKEQITLYPRAANKGGQAAAPNSFTIIKEVKSGQGTIYIVPCTTLVESTPSNCVRSVLLLGCYKLSLTSPANDSISIDSAFDITREINQASGTQLHGMNWGQCKAMFPVS